MLQRFERSDERHELHAIVRRVAFSSAQFFFMPSVFEDAAPSADIDITLIAGACAVRIDVDVFHGSIITRRQLFVKRT